ncbi:HAD-IA family hydrolase [Ponticaulis sp.]|uniref:HAD-IA family hydrolase n=1 Tax=Ponticaulis sp. TaxID=2020902 RepID=UPI000B6999A8|nr:HAD-IA family hydrolase [Ponticaulis sp.]MAI89095.1 haloacid dehalogenase [Ponticaulis sp.]OUY01378.1 MAG: haloacid dehalogenase [Hyphomonadaceae bacterium TMED5]
MSLRLVVWDLDGTIIDSRKVIQNAMTAAFEEFGLEPPEYDRTRQIVGLGLEDGCRILAPQGTSEKDVAALALAYKNAFVAHRTNNPDFKEPLYEGAVELLESLANQNCLMGVATGKSRRGIEAVFGMHDLHQYFDTIWCADDGPGKPHPFMVMEAMKAIGAEADETVMIGDAIHDIHMGRSAGVVTHGVSWGFGEAHELEAAGAHHIHHEMESLSDALHSFVNV